MGDSVDLVPIGAFYGKGKRTGAGKEYDANGKVIKVGEWSNGVFASGTQQLQEELKTSAQNQNLLPLKGFSDALNASIDIAKNNPRFINFITSTASTNDIAMCTALGMKAAAFSAVNPEALNAMNVKLHALNAAGMMLSHKVLDDKGVMPNGAIKVYVNIFNPMSFADILERNWSTCDHIMAGALKSIDQNELASYLQRPYQK
jgi:hypothetical protein